MYIHIYIYICVCVYTYVYIYIYISMYAHTHIYIYIYIHTHMYVYIYICTCIYVRKLPVLSTSIQPRQLAWQFVSRSVSTVACRAVWGATRARAGQAYSPSHQAGNQGAGRANCRKGFKTHWNHIDHGWLLPHNGFTCVVDSLCSITKLHVQCTGQG